MSSLQKNKPFRSKQYRDYISSLPCCVTGDTPSDCHHITGTKKGGMSTKIGDNYCIPITRSMHTQLHSDPKRWELLFGTQQSHLDRTLFKARNDDMLDGFTAWKTGL